MPDDIVIDPPDRLPTATRVAKDAWSAGLDGWDELARIIRERDGSIAAKIQTMLDEAKAHAEANDYIDAYDTLRAALTALVTELRSGA